MSGDLYRDADVGLRARIAELTARIEARESEVTEAFWQSLAPLLRGQLGTLRRGPIFGPVMSAEDSLEELTRTEAMLATYLDELERLMATLPAMEAEWAIRPDDVADPPEPKLTFRYGTPTVAEAAAIYRHFGTMVRERDRDAQVLDLQTMYLARFRERGCPFALRATLFTQGNGQVAEVGMWLVTSIARALPPLVVRHETRSPAVQAQLLALSRFDIPTLDIDPETRTASLRWRFEPAAKALDAAVRILTAVRESRPSVRFRNE
jgi:hypothetical protein